MYWRMSGIHFGFCCFYVISGYSDDIQGSIVQTGNVGGGMSWGCMSPQERWRAANDPLLGWADILKACSSLQRNCERTPEWYRDRLFFRVLQEMDSLLSLLNKPIRVCLPWEVTSLKSCGDMVHISFKSDFFLFWTSLMHWLQLKIWLTRAFHMVVSFQMQMAKRLTENPQLHLAQTFMSRRMGLCSCKINCAFQCNMNSTNIY